jgi:hypothetical protein
LFLGFRGHGGYERRDPSYRTWDRLQGDARFAAGIALHQLETCGWGFGDRRIAYVDLKVRCAPAVFGVAHYCLENRERLADYSRHLHDDSLVTFWIGILGKNGNPSALHVLRGFIDDARHGRAALDAIHAIQARENGGASGHQ